MAVTGAGNLFQNHQHSRARCHVERDVVNLAKVGHGHLLDAEEQLSPGHSHGLAGEDIIIACVIAWDVTPGEPMSPILANELSATGVFLIISSYSSQ